MCVPRPDSASVFNTMIDRGAGAFRVAPFGVTVPTARRYLPGTLVLETTWQTPTGWLVVQDALIMSPWHNTDERSLTHRRTPTDDDAAHCLLRTITCANGTVDLSVTCEPVFNDAERRPAVAIPDGQLHGGRRDGEGPAGIATDRFATPGRGRTRCHRPHHDAARRSAPCRVDFSELPAPDDTGEALQWLERTSQYWRQWLSQGRFPDHPWRSYLQSSALALKGLTYAPTGALLAAATTSLPQIPGGDRNWDYRYTFVRDATFALWGLYTLGFDREANDFFYFIHDTCHEHPEDLQVIYDIRGDRPPVSPRSTICPATRIRSRYESATTLRPTISTDPRAPCSTASTCTPGRATNCPRNSGRSSSRRWNRRRLHWAEPDQGIWDIGGAPQQYTATKILSWVAVDRGVRLARLHDSHTTADKWQFIADEIHADILRNGVDENGVFTQYYGAGTLDSALLLAPLFRFLAPDDPRIRATVLAIADRLGVHGLPRRYQTGGLDDNVAPGDDLDEREPPFLLCSFWLVSALAEIGEIDRARALCERLLAHASPLGLYAEALDPVTGRHLGNYPQGLTHLALINAVTHLIRAEQASRTHTFSPANQRTG